MRLIILCILGAGVTSARPQVPYSRLPQQYREPLQAYQDDPRYPVGQPEQYQTEHPRYLKKHHQEIEEDLEEEAGNSIPGTPGKDYPVHSTIPATSFSCRDKLPGFYVDEPSGCQVWHYCKTDGLMESFLCPNGTIYNQGNRVCEWWFNVNCDAETIALQSRINEDLYIIPSPKPDQDTPVLQKTQVHSQYSEPQYDSENQYQQGYQGYQDQSQY
ncbi:hypothetical protein OTU49_012924 [Cherax quadricarinatus]|uniref:Chitin-binding type-2 domain-containing protein n=2 Tax=Cherax quadricarinatus TaxID=27406 RepID=A0AAW0VVL6_CHEQU